MLAIMVFRTNELVAAIGETRDVSLVGMRTVRIAD